MKAKLQTVFVILALYISMSTTIAQQFSNQAENLPTKAQEFLKTYYANTTVYFIEVDKDLFGFTYKVKLSDNTEIEFSKKGEWLEVNSGKKPLHTEFILSEINNHLSNNFDKSIYPIKIERKGSGYKVELSNEIEVKFNSKGKLIKYDY